MEYEAEDDVTEVDVQRREELFMLLDRDIELVCTL